jgi:hypothetical protein
MPRFPFSAAQTVVKLGEARLLCPDILLGSNNHFAHRFLIASTPEHTFSSSHSAL